MVRLQWIESNHGGADPHSDGAVATGHADSWVWSGINFNLWHFLVDVSDVNHLDKYNQCDELEHHDNLEDFQHDISHHFNHFNHVNYKRDFVYHLDRALFLYSDPGLPWVGVCPDQRGGRDLWPVAGAREHPDRGESSRHQHQLVS